MAYEKYIGKDNPTMLLILLDQSASMAEPYSEVLDKQTAATQIVNTTISKIGNLTMKGGKVSDRIHVGVIGYGASVELIIDDMISKILGNPKGIKKIEKVAI